MLVKPASGLAVRDPATKMRVPDEGLYVADDSPLWNRMIADGDFVRIPEPKPAAKGADA